jgi:isopenicillin N synthase-like dioxygenase
LHYPPVEAASVASAAVARMPAHTDWGSVTMLFQDDCGGLEVENPHKPGQFITATPIKNALVMNVGDLLMRWSNGTLDQSSSRALVDTCNRRPEIDSTPSDAATRPGSIYWPTSDDQRSIFDSVLRESGLGLDY